jgi:hypothetical protein
MTHVGKLRTVNSCREDFRQILEENRIPQSTVAKELGYSPASLSLWLAGKYAGDSSKVEESVLRWINDFHERNLTQVSAGQYVETEAAKQITKTLRFAQLLGNFCCVYGASGLGKTTTIQNFIADKNNAWLVTMSPAQRSLKSVLGAILEGLHVPISNGNNSQLRREIVDRLNGSAGILVIDEAQHCTWEVLEEVRSIHDQCKVGLVLVGSEKVYGTITGGARRAEYAQIFSRIAKSYSVQTPTKECVHAVARGFGITDNASLGFLYDVAARRGALRMVTGCIAYAQMLANGAEKPLDVNFLKAAYRELVTDVA